MRICIVHQYYKTPKTGGAIRSFYIAKYLKSLGHEITVITAGNNTSYKIDESDGYPVHYLPIYYENHLAFYSRIHAFLLYVWKAYKLIKKLNSFDLNYIITTPLTTGFIGLRAKKKLKIPYIFEVGDLWPEAPIQLGILKNKLLIKISEYYEKTFYYNAHALVALSPDIRDHIISIVPDKKTVVITNFSDKNLFNQTAKQEPSKRREFVISYMGTVGLANHLEFLLDCANEVINENVKFIVAGGGAQFQRIKNSAHKRGLENISFQNQTDKEGVAKILSKSDAVFVSFDNVPVLGSGSPNKFFDGLAAGKIIIINFKGWVKKLIEENNCGFYYNPLKPEEFKKHIMLYLNNESLTIKAKNNSCQLAQSFSPDIQLKELPPLLII